MSDKIYLSGTFAYREDTLENWQNANPILEKGEPSIVRDGADGEWLKIGDGVTAWNDLPWKRGPRGLTGPKGEQGIQGKQGPQGEKGKDAITDQTYSPKSTNAQSGKAVSQAVSEIADQNSIQDRKIQALEDSQANFVAQQTYDPESPLAQSGNAVAQAVNKPWQLIYGTTLSETITQLRIDKEQYPEFKEIHIEARI